MAVVLVVVEEEDGGEVMPLGRPKDGYWILVLPIID